MLLHFYMISCAYQKGAMTATEVCEGLGLYDLKNRLWHIQGSCALKGDGLYEGLDWLAGTLKELQASGRLPSGGTSLFWVEGISDQRSLSKTRFIRNSFYLHIVLYRLHANGVGSKGRTMTTPKLANAFLSQVVLAPGSNHFLSMI
jgi:hypothetical protein